MLGSRAHYAARPSRAAASNLPLRRHRVLPVTAGSSHHHASEQSRTRAYPERRTSSFSTIRSPVLRSLARRTVPISRETLEERYGAPLLVGGKAASQQQQMSAISYAPTASQQRLPRLLQPQQQADAAAVEESPLARDALVLILLATAVSFVCSIDRAAMSVAILPMSDQFNWDDTVKGSVSSAFFAGYMITNLCGGFLATRYSAKHVLASGVVLWSLFTIATPAAAAGNLGELMLARAMMGVGEGVTYPSIQNLVRQRVPEQKRSRALAFIYSGHQLGTIGSYLLCPLLIAHLGWESVFWIFGALGFVWLAGWLPLVSDRYQPPAPAPKLVSGASSARGPAPGRAMAVIPAAAASAAVAEAPAAPAEQLRLQDVPWASFAANPAFWAIVAAQCTVSVGNVLAFSWLPTFYNQVYGVDVAGSAAYSVLPFVVTVLATNAGGWIADGLVNNGVIGKTHTRKLMQAIASLGPAVCLLQLAANHGGGEGAGGNVTDAVALVTAWCSLSGFSAAGYGSNHQDISKQYSGILYGLANGLASVAASASIYATGQVLHYTHDWSLVFEVAAGLNVVGALAYLKWASSDEQFATAAQPATTKAKAQ